MRFHPLRSNSPGMDEIFNAVSIRKFYISYGVLGVFHAVLYHRRYGGVLMQSHTGIDRGQEGYVIGMGWDWGDPKT
jgi:hypothetical protein